MIGFPWLATALAALPAGVLGVLAGVAGLHTPAGISALIAGIAYLVLGLWWIQPRIDRTPVESGDPAERFLRRAMKLENVEQIADEFRHAVSHALGTTHAVVIAPTASGGVRAIGAEGGGELEVSEEAFGWLSDCSTAVSRQDLARHSDAGARATLALMERLGGHVALPLRHRGALLGVGLIGPPRALPGAAGGFYQAIRAATTAAMANTYLDAQAKEGSGLARTFDLATAMQESLMPDDRVVRRPTFELKGMCVPVAECGGDLWSWRELGQGRLLLLIADATGHGAAPALLAAVAKGAIDAGWQLMGADLDPAGLLQGLNRAIHRVGRTRYMMTAFAAVLDKTARELRYANAAQNFPFFIRGGGGEPQVEVLVSRGDTLGARPEASYVTERRSMEPGDKLLLYTDGIIDAASPQAGPFGERRLRAAVRALARERATRIPDLLMAEVQRFTGGALLVDDITMAAAEFATPGAGEERGA